MLTIFYIINNLKKKKLLSLNIINRHSLFEIFIRVVALVHPCYSTLFNMDIIIIIIIICVSIDHHSSTLMILDWIFIFYFSVLSSLAFSHVVREANFLAHDFASLRGMMEICYIYMFFVNNMSLFRKIKTKQTTYA